MKIRVASYNIHKGMPTVGTRPRVHALKAAIAKLDADLVFLQEVQGRHDLHALRHGAHWPNAAQHDFLASDQHGAAYGANAIYEHGHHGNALLSNLPILKSQNQDISDHAYESRGILHCVLHAPLRDQEIHCYVVHFGLFPGGRQRQSEALIEAVKASAGIDAPVVIAGDFNDWGDHLGDHLRVALDVCEVFEAPNPAQASTLSERLRRRRGVDALHKPARTFPAALPMLRLDRIYVRGFQVNAAEVMHGLHWARLSDHAPIVAEIELL